MLAIASTVMSRFSLRRQVAAFALMLLPAALWAQAPIQITPLPEAKHATVQQLGAADLDARDLQTWLDAEMSGVMRQGAIGGAVVVVVKDGELLPWQDVLANVGFGLELAGQFLLILPFALPGYLSFMALRGFTSAT